MNKLSFQLDESDLRNAARLSVISPFRVRIAVSVIIAAIILLAGMMRRHSTSVELAIWAGISALAGLFMFVSNGKGWSFSKSWVERLRKQQSDILLPTTISWNEMTLTFGNPKGEYRHVWTDFLKWKADDNTLIVYVHDNMFRIASFKNQATGAIDEILGLLKANGVEGLDLRTPSKASA